MSFEYLPPGQREEARLRASQLYGERTQQIARSTDRLVVGLLILQWGACALLAAGWGPKDWGAGGWSTSPLMRLAVLGGGLSVAGCALLFLARPASAVTRQVIGGTQMIVAALLAALIDGPCESRAYLFGSLALLSLYRDWRVLVWASLVAATDLLLRSTPWPAVVAGQWGVELVRVLEKAAWIVLADVVLIYSCRQSAQQKWSLAERQATLEMTNQLVEAQVAQRTASLRQSNCLNAAVVQTALDSIISMDERGRITEFNAAAERTFGYCRADVLGQDMAELIVPPALRDQHRDGLAHFLATGESRFLEIRRVVTAMRAGGEQFPAELALTHVVLDGKPVFMAYVRDISERIEQEELLRRSEMKLRSVFESPMMGIGFWDVDGAVREANPALLRMAGYTADDLHAGAINWFDMTPPDQMPRTQQALAEITARGVCTPHQREFLRKDGSRFSVMISAASLSGGEHDGVACLLDITERKRAEEALRRAEEQLRHVQKIEGIGRLAGGIAHDFNNVLTIIRSFAELIVDDEHALGPMRDAGQEILHATERAAALTQQLLAFSRKQVLAPARLDLNAVVSETGAMLHRLIGPHVELVLDLAPNSWIHADRSQIEQVLLNLAVNAQHAMPDGGQIRIATAVTWLDAGHPDFAEPMLPGPYVLLTVRDTGCGMSEEVRKHVFEPFYTTKPAGKGTGMGLAIVYGIVTQSGGSIAIDSAPGQGTTLRAYLPQDDEFAGESAAGASDAHFAAEMSAKRHSALAF